MRERKGMKERKEEKEKTTTTNQGLPCVFWLLSKKRNGTFGGDVTERDNLVNLCDLRRLISVLEKFLSPIEDPKVESADELNL